MMYLVLAHFQHNISTKRARKYSLYPHVEYIYSNIPIFYTSLVSVLLSQLWQIALSPLPNPRIQWSGSSWWWDPYLCLKLWTADECTYDISYVNFNLYSFISKGYDLVVTQINYAIIPPPNNLLRDRRLLLSQMHK